MSLRNTVIRVWVALVLLLNTLPICLADKDQKYYIFPYYPDRQDNLISACTTIAANDFSE
jgi:hypothetical protein